MLASKIAPTITELIPDARIPVLLHEATEIIVAVGLVQKIAGLIVCWKARQTAPQN